MGVMSFHRHKLLFIAVSILFFALFALQANAGPDITREDREKLFDIASEEFLSVTEFLNSIDKDELPRGDYDFYDFWLKGLEKEKEGKPSDAIAFYKKALAADVFEMSTYDVLFSLGRAYLLVGEKDRALSTLQEFIKNAEADLSAPGPWGFTPEGEQALRKSIAQARWLITFYK
jgi:tetratricopeptide (TPR) repeat protein